nr:MAG TPA: hypothetical protein [Caudoviricetes sp.]
MCRFDSCLSLNEEMVDFVFKPSWNTPGGH